MKNILALFIGVLFTSNVFAAKYSATCHVFTNGNPEPFTKIEVSTDGEDLDNFKGESVILGDYTVELGEPLFIDKVSHSSKKRLAWTVIVWDNTTAIGHTRVYNTYFDGYSAFTIFNDILPKSTGPSPYFIGVQCETSAG